MARSILPNPVVTDITLLAVWAHPDDEAYLGAGLMAAVADAGGKVVSATATLGEHGTDKPMANPPHRLAGVRKIELENSLGVLGARPLLVHAIQVTDQEIDLVAKAGCAVTHCPRSNDRLSCGRTPLERYLAAGVPVYLGTDSLASSPSLDVREESEFAQALHAKQVSPEQITQCLHRTL